MHSEKFEKVKYYYKNHLWDLTRVKNAVGNWITKEEYEEITGKKYN